MRKWIMHMRMRDILISVMVFLTVLAIVATSAMTGTASAADETVQNQTITQPTTPQQITESQEENNSAADGDTGNEATGLGDEMNSDEGTTAGADDKGNVSDGDDDSVSDGDSAPSEAVTEENENADVDMLDGMDASTRALSDHTVMGLDPHGTSINLFDYWTTNRLDSDINDHPDKGINADHVLKFTKSAPQKNPGNINKWTGSAQPRLSIVQNELGDDGYPHLNPGVTDSEESLSYLFDPNQKVDGKESFENVSGLLQVCDDHYYCYDSKENFAEFNETNSEFILYDRGGVDTSGNVGEKVQGQFFPFNTGQQVFKEESNALYLKPGVYSDSGGINHYFGVTMRTQFVQQENGTSNGKDVTYEFSGDDDVWIFIDGKLVGDLGGKHNMASITINFHTGKITINEVEQSKSLGGLLGYETNTLPDNTYHTLDFYYLERGNNNSNMSLKYNLVTIPQTDIVKIDQDGAGVTGAKFTLYAADKEYENLQEICNAETGPKGDVVLMKDDRTPITLDEIWTTYANFIYSDSKLSDELNNRMNLVLKEESRPQGYRGVDTYHMYLWHTDKTESDDNATLLLSDDPWTSGAYSVSRVAVQAPDQFTTTSGETVSTSKVLDSSENGIMFAIVEKQCGDKQNDQWCPVYGDPVHGWTVADSDSFDNIQTAFNATKSVFELSGSGAYETQIDQLPGDLKSYAFFLATNTEYRVAYYYSTDKTGMTEANTFRITDTTGFYRRFAARMYVSNIINRVIVQKQDEDGNPVNGVEMGLFASDTGGNPLTTCTTRELTKTEDFIDMDGACIFTKLETGKTYYVGEVEAPAGYAETDTRSKIIVMNTGVYADAGTEDDGVKVTRGVGRIVRSMIQFAVNDRIDTTLHDIVAYSRTASRAEELPPMTELTGNQLPNGDNPLHFQYADNDKDAVLDYEPNDNESYTGVTMDVGIPYMRISQCDDHSVESSYRQDIDRDITNLFTGVTVVQIANQRVGNLDITKHVEGTSNSSSEFAFSVTFKIDANSVHKNDPSGALRDNAMEKATYCISDEQNKSCIADDKLILSDSSSGNLYPYTFTFYLHDGQTIHFKNVPTGTQYEVVETEYPLYQTTYENDASGSIPTPNEKGITTNVITVTNTYISVSSLPLTGGDMTARNCLAFGGILLLLGVGVWILAGRRRN